jgi:MOSC domain-containing protein YiiM
MRILSLNVGLPRLVMRNGEPVSTGIYKAPITTPVMLRTLNLEGDRQADLSVHGGPSKAAYAYPSEHYEFWQKELPEMELPYGMFGENFTTTELSEHETFIGDQFSVGGAIVIVTQPRMPCYKLALRFGRNDILRRFLTSQRTGFYLAVKQEGVVSVGDELRLIERQQETVTVVDITRLYASEKYDIDLLRKAIAVEALPDSWKEYFEDRLSKLTIS